MARAGDLVFMGPPGSGKGTQAKRLVTAESWLQLSTGDLFRSHIAQETELGKKVKAILDSGKLVTDDVTVDMVRVRLREIPSDKRIVFDGFPRTVAQAKALDALLAEFGRRVDGVILLEVPRDEILQRLIKRAKDEGRADDTPEAIGTRFDAYEQQTKPLIDFFGPKVRRVNGVGPVDEVAAWLRKAAYAGAEIGTA